MSLPKPGPISTQISTSLAQSLVETGLRSMSLIKDDEIITLGISDISIPIIISKEAEGKLIEHNG
jgi:hypothetical protein